MKKDKHINIFKKEDGAGLVLALMVLMVLAVLGVAVAGVTIGSHKLGDISRDSNSAYYIAEAGANLAYEEIKNGVMPAYLTANGNEIIYYLNINERLSLFSPERIYAEGFFAHQFGQQPKATVTVSGPEDHNDGKLYRIKSVGTIGDDTASRVVEKEFLLKWVPISIDGQIPSTPLYSSLVIKNNVNINGGEIKNDVYLDSKTPGSFVFGQSGSVRGDIYTNYPGDPKEMIVMPNWRNTKDNLPYNEVHYQELVTPWSEFEDMLDMIVLPEGWESYNNIGNLSPTEGTPSHISENIYANKIDVGGSKVLIIDNIDRDIYIVVNELSVSGSGKIIFAGTGNVHFYVRNSFNLTGSGTINAGGDRSNLRVYYFGNNSISLGGSVKLNGNLLVDRAKVNLGGSGNITGALISGGNTVNLTGGTFDNVIMILPKGDVHMSGSAEVHGIIVANSFSTTGNPRVSFDTFNSGVLFPEPHGSGSSSGSSGSGSGEKATLEALISPGPTLEP